ncbi:MAG: DUF3999 family protein [Vicinamibacteria bacterium]|nr:DUF3999 family protein [Vicinamibacteria bacterium]
MKTRRTWIRNVAIVGLLLSRDALAGEIVDHDEIRSAWRFRRQATLVAAPDASFASLVVPLDLAARSRPDLSDLRLLRADGTEVPYVVDRLIERASPAEWSGRLVDTRRELRRFSRWTVDCGESRVFDTLSLDVPERDFAKSLRIESSADGRSWRVVVEDVGVFDRQWGERIHHARVVLADAVEARYLRITADDRRSRPVMLAGVRISRSGIREEERWSLDVAAAALPAERGVSRYRLDAPPGLPFERISLDAEERAFHRRVVLRAQGELNGRGGGRVLADGRVYRLHVPEESLAGEQVDVAVGARRGGELLLLEIHDDDSPPLSGVRVTLSGVVRRLIFPAAPGRLVLYYDNPRARAAHYDIQILRDRMISAGSFAEARLGDEVENPRYRPAPPLPFVATRGAALDASAWRRMRRVTLTEGDDLYSVTIDPSDLNDLRADLADLRLVDDAGLQVPFILDSESPQARMTLAVRRLPVSRKSGGRTHSLYRLSAGAVDRGKPSGMPIRAVELEFAESFFDRWARLATASERRNARVLYDGTLARRSEQAGALVIALDEGRVRELTLEIDEGDNAPLTLKSASAVVRVPRIVFKAALGSYRLLLGNPRAETPRYDIATLRNEVLCYSSRVAGAAPSEPNPGYRRGFADSFSRTPPTLALWLVLGISVLALLFLTVHVLRKADAPRDQVS